MSDLLDSVVIGAGVVGLAIARELALSGREVVVLEKNERIGEETSSRNSEVIHAGIYYATDSLKARLCVAGKAALYRYCAEKNVAFDRCGKIIVAVDDEQSALLDALARQAERNGVADIERLDRAALERLEPAVRGVRGLWSPSTGIVDIHAFMLALQGDLEAAGGMVAFRSRAEGIAVEPDAIRIDVRSGDDRHETDTRLVVNAAGLHASEVARRCSGVEDFVVPETRFAKGNYFMFHHASPFSHLVYPLPMEGGLGVHATLDLAGRVRFGPDVEWSETVDYSIDPGRAGEFYRSIRTYWPDLPDGSLSPGYVGVRPKLSGPGEPPADFRIDLASGSDRARLIHLFGIESPGLTAALAIARHVRELANAD